MNPLYLNATGRVSGLLRLVRLGWSVLALLAGVAGSAAVLTTLELRVLGTRLAVVPGEVTVPRNIEGSVRVEFVAGDGTVVPAPGSMAGRHVEGLLRGPGMAARKVTARVGDALLLPPLRVSGDYQLDDVRLVDTATGTTVLAATPASVPVHVFDEVLVSQVVSRPLTSEEIAERGIVIDASSFRVVEFEVALVLKGGTFPVRLPVVAPEFRESTEIIPASELEERRVTAEAINRELASALELPPEIQAVMPDFTIQPIQFEEVGPEDEVERRGPGITGLLVIPGRIGYLNQFFSVQLYTENASPAGSGLTVTGLRAGVVLPKGRDGIAGTTLEPGDDPLRMARVGSGAVVSTNLPVRMAGLDGKPGTEDDMDRIEAGDTGMAEFLVEGLREGLHTLEFELRGTLEGLAAGPTVVRGRTTGAVLVRNARFSMAFLHPMQVRAGEPYLASVTLVNTGDTVANRLTVGMNREAMSGTVLLGEDQVELGDVAPGQSVTAQFRFRSQRTGQVLFSNLSTSEDSVSGRLQFTAGVDERGVDLSVDAIGFPAEVMALPEGLRRASDRVLGQALGVATAARLPDGVLRLTRAEVIRRVLDLAEAGRRVRLGDPLERVLADVVRDWQGVRSGSAGFEQILRETAAGNEWRAAVAALVGAVDGGPEAWLSERGTDLAGTGMAGSWLAASADTGSWRWVVGDAEATAARSGIQDLLVFPAVDGSGAWISAGTNRGMARWTADRTSVGTRLRLVTTGTNGLGTDWSWTLPATVAGDVFTLTGVGTDQVELRGPGAGVVPVERVGIRERAPEVVAVEQDISVTTDRAWLHCPLMPYNNWGTVVGVLFSKPVTPATAEVATAYVFPDGNGARTVRLQADGRVAYVQLHRGIGSFAVRPRDYRLTVVGVEDARGGRVAEVAVPVAVVPAQGVAVRGRVYGLDGLPAPGVPVTLTMIDRVGNRCLPSENRVAQVFTDAAGMFDLDFVAADVAFTIAAVDTRAMDEAAARVLLGGLLEGARDGTSLRARLEALAVLPEVKTALLQAFNAGSIGQAIVSAENVDRATYTDRVELAGGRMGTELVVALRFRGRGVVAGRVFGEDGVTPVAGAAVNLFPDAGSRELVRGVLSGEDGSFRFEGVPLGEYSVMAEAVDTASGLSRTQVLAGRLLGPGEVQEVGFRLPAVVVRMVEITGVVQELDGRAHGHASVRATDARGTVEYARTEASADGTWRMRVPEVVGGVAAVSADGRRRGMNLGISLTTGVPQFIPVTLQGTTRVRGIVRYWNGDPAPGALVGGGDRVVRTGMDGRFELEGVPVGLRNFAAGIDGPNARDGISRVTSVGRMVVAGRTDDLELRLPARARIQGRVVDRAGQPVAGVRVSIPQPGGFLWTMANPAGVFEFNGLGLGNYTVSAPSPPVKEKADELAQRALDAIASASDAAGAEEAAALVGQLAQVYVSGTVGRFASGSFDPGAWGFSETSLAFDGQTVVVEIQYLPGASLSGVVLNGQGVPVGAEVTVSAFGPNEYGAPSVKPALTVMSDPGEGTWRAGGFIAGPFTVHASSPLLVGRPSVRGLLTPERPSLTNVVLRFPAQADLAGRLMGIVYDPDGIPVPGAKVAISLSSDYEITADGSGWFDTQLKLPAGSYEVVARSTNGPSDGLMGQVRVQVVGGVTNVTTVPLLGRGEATVEVVDAAGRLVTNAPVKLVRAVFPAEAGIEQRTGLDGRGRFEGVFEGEWSAEAMMSAGVTVLRGVSPFRVVRGSNVSVRVVLGASGSVAGTFQERDTGATIGGATVWIRSKGIVVASGATTGDGRFRVDGVPLGSYEVEAVNPVNGRRGFAGFGIANDGEGVTVAVVEQALGLVEGVVRDAVGMPLSGLEVVLTTRWPGDVPRRVTSGVDGVFRFPGVPAGTVTVTASDRALGRAQAVTALLSEGSDGVTVELQMPPLLGLTVRVVDPAEEPVPQARVLVSPVAGAPGDRLEVSVGADGTAEIGNVRAGNVRIQAADTRAGSRSSMADTNFVVGMVGPRLLRVQLTGVGGLSGRVSLANGAAAVNARVDLLEGGRSVLTDASGRYVFTDVAVGTRQVRSVLGSLAAQSSVMIVAGATATLDLVLGGSGGIEGTLVRATGQPVRERPVLAVFPAAAGAQGEQLEETDTAGRFAFGGLPLGVPVTLTAALAETGARAEFTVQLTTNGEVLDLGQIRMDEAAPGIVSVQPGAGSVDIPTNVVLRVEFDEPLRASGIRPAGFELVAGEVAVPVEVRFEPALEPTVVTVRPLQALRSRTAHQLVIAGADRVDGNGRPARVGVVDRVGRELDRTVVVDFVTRDSEAPVIVSMEPEDGRVEVEPMAVMRVALDEPVMDGWGLELRDGSGVVVPARAGMSADRRLLTLVPERALALDARHVLVVSGVTDLSGNTMGSRTNVFTTLDTRPPEVTRLGVAAGQQAASGSTVTIEAEFGVAETGATLVWLREGEEIGATTTGPVYRLPVRLPVRGTVTLGAYGRDALGNRGATRVLVLEVVPNSPPVITLARGPGETGPLRTGEEFSLAVSATDDAAVRRMVVTLSGALTNSWERTNGLPFFLTARVPAQAVAGVPVRVRVVASDEAGAEAKEQTLEIPTEDATRPVLATLLPEAGPLLEPAEPLRVDPILTDNSRRLRVLVEVTGALAWRETRELEVTPGQALTLPWTLDLSSLRGGGSVTVSVEAWDLSGNASARVARSYQVRDVEGPRLASTWIGTTPAPVTNRVSRLVSGVAYRFDTPVRLDAGVTNLLVARLTNGMELPGLARINGVEVQWAFTGPVLPADASVEVRLLPGLVDGSGNGLRLPDGTAWPVAGVPIGFTTGPEARLGLTNGQPVVAGLSLWVALDHDPSMSDWSLLVNGASVGLTEWTASRSRFRVTLPHTNVIRVVARTTAGGRAPLELPPVFLNVRPDSADDDGDGLPNGFEARMSSFSAAVRLDPFDPGDGQRDHDNDGLTAVEEYRLGTSLVLRDTDGDGLSDGQEVAAGNCLDPLDPDSDDDGVGDQADLAPCVPGEGVVVVPVELTATEGVESVLRFALDPFNVVVGDVRYPGGVVPLPFLDPLRTRLLPGGQTEVSVRVRPGYADAGTYSVPFQVSLRRTSDTVITNIAVPVTIVDSTTRGVTRWAVARSGDWMVATNWTDGLPGPGRDAVIDLPGSYVVTVGSTVFAESLRFEPPSVGPVLRVTGVLGLNEASRVGGHALVDLSWGTINGRGRLDVAGRVQGQGTFGPGGVILESGGSWTSVAGNVSFAGPFLNAGLMDVRGWTASFDGPSTNEGTIRMGTALTGSGAVFRNLGLVESGQTNRVRLTFQRLEQAGRLVVSGDLLADGAATVFAAEGTNAVGGRLLLNAGRHEFRTSLDVPDWEANNATLVLEVEQRLRGFVGTWVMLEGAGTLSVSGLAQVQSTVFRGEGLFRLESSGRLLCPGTSLVVSRPMDLAGETTLTNGAFWHVTGATVTNRGTMTSYPRAYVYTEIGAVPGKLMNVGSLRIHAAGAGNTDVNWYPTEFENAGEIVVEDGTVSLTRSVRLGGTTRIEAGAVLASGGNLTQASGSVVEGAGTLVVEGGTAVLTEAVTVGEVRLTQGNLRAEAAQSWERFRLTGGRLLGAGVVRIGEVGTLTGGTLDAGADLVVSATAAVTNTGSVTLSRRCLNEGRLVMTGNAHVRLQGGELVNSGTMNLGGQAYFWSGSVDPGPRRVRNQGLLVASGSVSGQLWSEVNVVNNGRVEVASGTLTWPQAVENDGEVAIAPGASLVLSGSSTHLASGEVTGPGLLSFSGGTHRLLGPLAVERIALGSGTLELVADQAWRTFVGSGGVVGGSGSLRVTGQFHSTGSPLTFGPGGPLEIGTNAVATVATGFVALQRDLVNQGRLVLSNSATLRPAGVTVHNRATMEFTGGSGMFGSSGAMGIGRVLNEGVVLLRNTADPSGWTQIRVENQGRIEVLGGRWNPSDTLVNSGELIVGVGTWVQLGSSSTNLSTGRMTGPGRIEFGSGTHTMEGTLEAAGGLVGTGGTLMLPASLRVGSAVLNGVLIDGAGDLEVAGSLSATTGTWRGTGAIRVLTGATGSLGGSYPNMDRLLHNAGTVAFRNDATVFLRNGTLRNEGLLLVTNGVTFIQGTTNARIELGGILRKSGPGTLTFQGGVVVQSGRVELAAGLVSGTSCSWRIQGGGATTPVVEVAAGGEFRWASGRIEVGAGGSAPFAGTGLLTLNSGGILALEAPLDLGTLEVSFNAGSQVTGNAPLANKAGGRFRFTGAVSIEGAVEIGGRMETTAGSVVRIDDRLTLLAGGALDNPGVVRVREFVNGGTVTGKAPEVRPVGPLRIGSIESVRLPTDERVALPAGMGSGGMVLRLRWEAEAGAAFEVERSRDLVGWERQEAQVMEVSPGRYEALVGAGPGEVGWYRLCAKWW